MPRPRLAVPAAALILLLLLGVSPWGLWERDEGRYADVAREMLTRGDFVTPRIDGAVFLDKPPLVYWVTAASLALWGRSETGARFGQLLFAAGILLVTRLIGLLLFERRRANLALLILASCAGFFVASHVLTLDLGLTFFVGLTLWLFLKGYRDGAGGARAYLGMFAAAAGGVLVKGPIAVVLPALTAGCFLTLRRDWRRAAELPWLRGAALFLAIAAPWFVAVSLANPEFLRYFFVHEHLQRFATPVHRHGGAWYYYLAVAGAGLMPWTLFLPFHLVRRLARQGLQGLASFRQEGPAFLWSWTLPGLLFFTVSQSKLPLYILPLFPPLALLVAAAVDHDLRHEPLRSVLLRPLLLLSALLAAAIPRGRAALGLLRTADPAVPLAVLAAGLILLGLVALLRPARGDPALARLVLLATVWMVVCETGLTAVGRIGFLNETRHFAEILRREMAPGDPVYAYQCYLRGLPFYLRRTVGLVSPHSDDLRFGLANGHDPGTFPDEEAFLKTVSGSDRVFVVVRSSDLQTLQRLSGRPLCILAWSESNTLVSNRLGADRARDLSALLKGTAFDLETALAGVERVSPGAAIETIDIERIAGVPQCTLRATRGEGTVAFRIPLDRPEAIAVVRDDPTRGESWREEHLLRLAPLPGSRPEISRLIEDRAEGQSAP